MVEVVVCRFGEDLAWTRNLPRGVRVTIYDKTPLEEGWWPGAIALPNHSRDDFAWLHHLVERYDDLADLTVFAQGHPFDHAPDLHRVIRHYAQGEESPDFAWLGFLWETDDARGRPSFVASRPKGPISARNRWMNPPINSSRPPVGALEIGVALSKKRESTTRMFAVAKGGPKKISSKAFSS